jgi:carbon-monoxide dehydrogenase medium subunit
MPMKPAPFDYHCPAELAEAIAILHQYGDDAKALAGGQSLIPLLSLRLSRFDHLVDLHALEELRGVTAVDGSIRIGAMTTQATVACCEGAVAVPLLAKATPHIGHYQIRNRGTLGGSLAHADPAAEYPAAAMAVEASLEVAGPNGSRRIPAAEFFKSPWVTVMQPDEVLVAAHFPVWSGNCGWAVDEVTRRAGDFAMCGAVCGIQLEGARVSRLALALFGVDSVPLRASSIESEATEAAVDDLDLPDIGAAVAATLDPPGDLHASGVQRRRMAKALVPRVLATAINEAKNA